MKPTGEEIRFLDDKVIYIRQIAKRNGILVEKLRLDYYEFEVLAGKVRDGLCLYYSEVPSNVQDNSYAHYTRSGSPISLDAPNWHEALPAYLKLLMGGPNWYKDEGHLRVIGQAKPSGFYGARSVRRGHPYAIFWKMPRKIRLYSCSPQPMECYVENCRLNLLFILTSTSDDYIEVRLNIPCDIQAERT